MEKRQFIQAIAVASLLPRLTPASAKPALLLAQKAPPQLDRLRGKPRPKGGVKSADGEAVRFGASRVVFAGVRCTAG